MNKIKQITIFCTSLLIQFSIYAQSEEKKIEIAIQPIGKVRQDLILKAKEDIIRLYNYNVVILKSISIPEEAYYKPRKRYRSEKLINIMTEELKGQYTRVLVLTEKDISTSVTYLVRLESMSA